MKTGPSKVVQVGRATVFTVGLVVVLSVMLGVATTAIAATPGDPFRLGKVNPINKVTKLVGQGKAPRLVVQNKGSGVALSLLVKPGKPPMTVNSATRVQNLNADRLDGKDSSKFLSSGNHYRKGELKTGNSNEINFEAIRCNTGDVMLSGGYAGLAESGHVFESHPAAVPDDAWTVRWTGDSEILIVVRCADLTP